MNKIHSILMIFIVLVNDILSVLNVIRMLFWFSWKDVLK